MGGFSIGSTDLCNETFLGGSPHSIKWASVPFKQEIKGNKTVTEGGLGRQLNNLITSPLWCAFTCRSLQTLLATFLFSNACLVESKASITPLFSYWFPPYHTTLPSLSPLPRPCSLSISPVTFILSLHPPPPTRLFPFFSYHLKPSNVFNLWFFCLHLSSISLPELLPRAAVPGGAPPVQAAAGRRGRVFLGELPVGPAQPWLRPYWGGAASRWRGHCRGYREAALPNGGFVCSRW